MGRHRFVYYSFKLQLAGLILGVAGFALPILSGRAVSNGWIGLVSLVLVIQFFCAGTFAGPERRF